MEMTINERKGGYESRIPEIEQTIEAVKMLKAKDVRVVDTWLGRVVLT